MTDVQGAGRDVAGNVALPLSSTERSRRHRARKRAAAGSGVGADGTWTPVFSGQRAAFSPGNQLGVRHGAYSPAIVGPLAERIANDLLGDADTPDYLRRPVWRWAIAGWANAEAEAMLMRAWRAGMSAEESATEFSESAEDETRPASGAAARKARGKRILPSLEALHKVEVRAATLRGRLGLDPVSAAKLGGKLDEKAFDLALHWAAQPEGEEAPGDDAAAVSPASESLPGTAAGTAPPGPGGPAVTTSP